jgi:hypothetical protein
MFWLDWDIAIEKMYNRASKSYQPKIAAILGVTQATVSRSIKVAKALNAVSRDLIYTTRIRSEGKDPIAENTILTLASLDDPEKVEKALPVILDRQYTEPQVKQLVAHIQAGGDPAQFEPAKKTPKKKSPTPAGVQPPQNLHQSLQEGPSGLKPQAEAQGLSVPISEQEMGILGHIKAITDKAFGPKQQVEGHGLNGPMPKPGIGASNAIGAGTRPAKAGAHSATSKGTKVGAVAGKTTLHLLTGFLKWAWSQFWKFVAWVLKLPFRMLGKGLKLCAEGQWVNGLIQLGFAALVILAVLWAWNHKGRVLGWGQGVAVGIYDTATGWAKTSPPAAQTPPQQAEAPLAPQTSPKTPPPTLRLSSGQAHSTRLTDSTKPVVRPPNHSPQAGSGQAADRRLSTKPSVTAPVSLTASPVDLAFAQQFGHDLYNLTFRNIEDRKDSLQSMVSEDFRKDFTDSYFYGDRIDAFHHMNLIYTYTLLQPVKMCWTDGKTEDFSFMGKLVMREEDNDSKQQTRNETFLVTIGHDAGGAPEVVDITEVASK